jgi:hypothetical protein
VIRRFASIAAFALVCGACASTARTSTGDEPASPVSTSSSVARCPAENPFRNGGGFDEPTGVQANLIVEYGLAHQDEYMGTQVGAESGGFGFKVLFSGHIAEHEVALRKIIEPSRSLTVVQTKHSPAEVAAVAADLADWHSIPEIQSASLPYSGGLPAIRLTLVPGSESVADRLIAKYGDLVSIEIAFHDYIPEGCGGSPVQNPCWSDAAAATTPPTSPTVTATLDFPASFGQRDEAQGYVRVQNAGGVDLAFYGSGSGIGGNVVDAATGEQVGEFRGAFTADLHPWLFPVGASVTVPVRVGATACGGSALSLKLGKYIARAELWLGPPVDINGSRNDFKATVSVIAETPIEITAG